MSVVLTVSLREVEMGNPTKSRRESESMRFIENKRKLERAEIRKNCRESTNPALRKALALAEAGYGFTAVAMGSGCGDDIARKLTMGV